MKIKLLDLCCGAGGASAGYLQAAEELGLEIEITGVDIKEQPNYPFNFIRGDSMEYAYQNYKDYTQIHISPPCQAYTPSTAQYRDQGKEYSEIMIEDIRAFFDKTKLPGVIENVPQSPIYPDVVLFGYMFGLKVIRKRHFELANWFMLNPIAPTRIGTVKNGDFVSVYGKAKWRNTNDSDKRKHQKIPLWRKKTIRETWAYAMGIEHYMKDVELSQAIPPAYTKYIGIDFFKTKI